MFVWSGLAPLCMSALAGARTAATLRRFGFAVELPHPGIGKIFLVSYKI
jgi:hypothetical protein